MSKKTNLYETHKKLGAKLIDFAGWEMPVQYTSILEEHKNVRENVGLFDVSHMGEIFVSGADTIKFLNKLVPQDINKLTDKKAVYCQLTNDDGGIIDDLIIYKLEDEHYLLIVNASGVGSDYKWIEEHSKDLDVKIDNQSDNYSLVAVQGPKAIELMSKIGLTNPPHFFHIQKDKLLDIDMYISRTGYTGEDGFEVLVKNEDVEKLWNTLMEEGKEFNIMPIGLGARDTLRLEAALPLYGNDLSNETTPIEAGLKWTVAKNKIEEYSGKEAIFNQLKNGISKKLVGLKILAKPIARHETEIYYNDEKIGTITSGGYSPTLAYNIALGYIRTDKGLDINSVVQVKIRDKFYDAQIIETPFVKKHYSN